LLCPRRLHLLSLFPRAMGVHVFSLPFVLLSISFFWVQIYDKVDKYGFCRRKGSLLMCTVAHPRRKVPLQPCKMAFPRRKVVLQPCKGGSDTQKSGLAALQGGLSCGN